jgi:hypothetical protein
MIKKFNQFNESKISDFISMYDSESEDKYAVVNIPNGQVIDSWLDIVEADNLASTNSNYDIVPMSEIMDENI